MITEIASEEEVLYGRALQIANGLGNRSIRHLVRESGSLLQLRKMTIRELMRLEGVNEKTANMVKSAETHIPQAEAELRMCKKKNIKMLLFSDPKFPNRLRVFDDSPVVLFYKGENIPMNKNRTIGVVGTRNATAFGKTFTETLVRDWGIYKPCIVSGLAYGIDVAAHQAALDNGLPTIGVLGNGLDFVYPNLHKKIANKMLENGGLISEFPPGTPPDRVNFPMRNRIVAMLSDALVVVEAAKKGGALITANMAFDYNKEVYAVPGKPGETYSEGCNDLIYQLKATLLHRPEQLPSDLNWSVEESVAPRVRQAELFIELSPAEQKLMESINKKRQISLDELCMDLQQKPSQLLGKLLELELKGLIKNLPGNCYASRM
ncbi:MAG: DNA-processing protein DprA [Cryomorphaceae bacterium]|nr:DNA-processing protein DprA [Cryomorphaceae bacterium]